MLDDKIIGRVEVYEEIKERLTNNNGKISIISIGGSGGIGKSYLLNKLLDDIYLEDNGYLVLKIDGNKKVAFEKYITEELVRSANHIQPTSQGYFNEVSALVKEWEKIDLLQKKQFIKLGKDRLNMSGEELNKYYNMLVRAGKFANNFVGEKSKMKNEIIFDQLQKFDTAEVIELFNEVQNKINKRLLEGRLPDPFGKKTKRFNLQQNFNQTAANALINDISYILSGSTNLKEKMKFKTTRSKISKSLKNLAIIIDDYECFQENLNEFFIRYFIPEVKKKNFKTYLVFVGRDLLLDTTQEWDKYVRYISQYELKEFKIAESVEYLNSLNINDENTINHLIDITEGYPYLLYLEAMNHRDGASLGAHQLKLFYDRTTKWMSEKEKIWFKNLCFLEVINVDNIKKMMSKENPDEIYSWLINEASIRDTKSSQYRIRPFISTKIKEYIFNESPENFNLMKIRAT